MSLLIDVLKKVQGSRKRLSVYPLLLKRKDTKKIPNRYALLLLPLVLVGFVGAYFLTQKILGGFSGVPAWEPPQIVSEKPKSAPTSGEDESSGMLPTAEETEKVDAPETQKEDVASPSTPPEEKRAKLKSSQEELSKLVADVRQNSAVSPEPPETSSLDYNAYIMLADESFRKGRLYDSARYYEKALKIKESKSVANNLLVVYVRLGEFEKARTLLRNFKDEELVYTYMVELTRAGLTDRALEIADIFRFVDKRGFVSFAEGYAFESKRDFARALKSYRNAYIKNPVNPYFAFNYARLLEASGKLKEAVSIYRSLKTMELEPKLKDIVRQRLRYFELLGL